MRTFTVSIYEPTIDLLRQAFANSIQDCRVELIKAALGWSRVYRMSLCRRDSSVPETVVVKTIDPSGPPTVLEAERELRFYQILHPGLCIPKPQIYALITDETTGFHIIVMEDLASTHRIPSHPHQWSHEELKSVLRAYAYLHTGPTEALDYVWLAPRHESLIDLDEILEQVAVVQWAGIWQELPGLPDLIAFVRESCRKYANSHLCLLHGDTTPANAALPEALDTQPATLIDWQDVGVGMAEFDLAYLDLQPFHSARLMPRPKLLDLYWRFRGEIDPDIPSPKERGLRQLHADAVTALWLARTASRVVLRPYPEGTYPHMHWASQYGIVYDRLKTLQQEINEVQI